MPEIERSGPKLIYQQIVDWMRQQISSGNWPEHYRLPSEIDLAAQLEVSRGTVRKAITELTAAGLLVSIHGRGTFVEASAIEQPLAEKLIAFSEALIEKKVPFTTQVIGCRLVAPPPRIASLLSIGPEYEQAAMDLGASPSQAIRRVLLPLLAPAILASVALVFADSVDDFVTVAALAGPASSETLAIKIYSAARSSPTPEVNAAATMMLVTTLLVIGGGLIFYKRVNRGQETGGAAEFVQL
jgi:DNA-binding transcriptional regulator YhcF (GntR family)